MDRGGEAASVYSLLHTRSSRSRCRDSERHRAGLAARCQAPRLYYYVQTPAGASFSSQMLIINRKLRSCVACRLDDHRNSTSRKEERGARHIPRKQRYVSRIISPRSERVCPWLGWARARQPREWRGATLKSEGVAKGPKLFSKRVGRSNLATAPPICRQHKAKLESIQSEVGR